MSQSVREVTAYVLQRAEANGMIAVQTTFLDHVATGQTVLQVATPNPEQVVLATENQEFFETLQQFSYLVPDGVGLVLAYWWWRLTKKGEKLPTQFHRVAGREVVEWWLAHAEKDRQHTTLLLGAGTGVAERLARKVDAQTQWCIGSMGYSEVRDLWSDQPNQDTLAEHQELFQLIKDWRPEVIFVAFGAPYQEMWIVRYAKELEKHGVKVVMVCGGAFDTLVGDASAAPRWVARVGLEWLWRLVQEPWRWRRQLRLITFLRGI